MLLTFPIVILCLWPTALASVTANDQIAFLNHGGPALSAHLPSDLALKVLSTTEHSQLLAHVASLPEPRLLEWADGHREWRTEGEKALVIWHEGGRRFVDVTHQAFTPPLPYLNLTSKVPDIPTKIKLGKDSLKPYFDRISSSRMRDRLTEFTSFRTRYYRSATGRQSQSWLLKQIKSLSNHHPQSNVSVSEFSHSWGQNTIIARFEPNSETSQSQHVVVIGAHQDSTNMLPFLPAPGADDDGSGSITILEAFDILLQQGWRPSDGAVEFHWYSAEEGGMLGSGAVADQYASQSTLVRSMLQFDMTAYVKKGTEERVGIVTDYVDTELSAFIRKLVEEYLTIPWVDTKCGYECSDHASWRRIGVPSAFGIESSFEDSSPYIHSVSDRLDVSPEFSFGHMEQFVRLALGYLTEMSFR